MVSGGGGGGNIDRDGGGDEKRVMGGTTVVLAPSGYGQALGISDTHMLYEKPRVRGSTCISLHSPVESKVHR